MVGDSPDIVGEGPISDLGDLEGWWDNHSIVAWSFALIGCFLLNGTLLLAFLIRPSLRTMSNRFVMNLTVSNLLVCAMMNPLIIMDVASATTHDSITESSSTASICAVSEGAVAIVTTSSVLSVFLIAVDQYFAVVDPLRYRARIDKLKSGILIMSTWFISITFGLLAFFNPNPRSFWLSCTPRSKIWSSNVTIFDSQTEPTIGLLENVTDYANVNGTAQIIGTIETVHLDDNNDVIENAPLIFDALLGGTVTYGLIYAILYAVFAYFIPFVAVCWIYVSIYVAAHRNSVRARRSGSRPILSSASFTEEQNCSSRLPRFQTDTIEDFRKLPKISSLSSIDETSETMQPIGQVSRRRSFSSSMDIELSSPPVEDRTPDGIVFTVGLQRVEVSPQCTNENDSIPTDNTRKSAPDSLLNGDIRESDSHRRDTDSDRTGKSSSDPAEDERTSSCWISVDFVDGSSDSEDEAQFECFDSLDAFRSSEKFAPLNDYPSALLGNELKVNNTRNETIHEVEVSQPVATTSEIDNSDQSEGRPLSVDVEESKIKEQVSQGDSRVQWNSSEAKTTRRLSTFASRDVAVNTSENRKLPSSCNKTEKDSSNTTEPSACLLTPIVTITPAPSKNDSLHRVSSVRSTSSYINSLKDRISNGSIFRHREETRAARISALVIVMGLICWSPYVILLVMKNLPRSTDQYLSRKYDVLASSLLILAAYISPLLFGYRSKRVKRELRRFFCFRRELSYKNNRSLMAKKVLKRRHSSTLSHVEMDSKYNIFNCVYGRNRWPKDKVQFVQVPDTALAVETCRSSFSSGASTQISSTSTEEC